MNLRAIAIVVGLIGCASSRAQIPVTLAPQIVTDSMEAIGSVADAGQPGTGVLRKLLIVPAGRSFRLTDLSLVTRRASTAPSPCIVEIFRGTEAMPTEAAWSRIKILDTETYDRSWNSPPTFGPGEVVWLRAYFDPFNTGLRLCVRATPNVEAEVVYAVRGYLTRTHGN
jgi:hypothetical protein